MPFPPPTFDLIFASLECWDEIWRRNQFLCALWGKRHPDRKILFVTPPRILPLALKNRDLASLRPKIETAPGHPNVTVFRPLRLIPSSFAFTRAFNDWHERLQVRAVARQLKLRTPALWLNSHFARHMAGKMGESALIYDITDDWIALNQRANLTERIRKLDSELCHLADFTIVCSQHLFDAKKSLTRRIELVPNGVDAAHYASVGDATLPPHPIARDWKHPVLGYTGSIHPDRVDVELVAALAAAVPEGTIALVGPDMLPSAQRQRLSGIPNVVMPGALPYSQIPDVMRAFDVCITPHLESDFTQSLNPIKLWEYLASGKPIVSTNVSGFRDYAPLVKIASGAPAFIAACRAALDEKDTAREERQYVARHNSWDARLDDVETILSAVTTS